MASLRYITSSDSRISRIFEELEKQVRFTVVCECAGFMRQVSIGVHRSMQRIHLILGGTTIVSRLGERMTDNVKFPERGVLVELL